MKNKIKISLTLSLLFLVATVSSCTRTIPTPTIESRITGKWTMKSAVGHYVVQGVSRNETTSYKATDYFDFKADGTISISETGKNYQGKWKVTNNKVIFSETNYIDYPNGFDIKLLTGSEFQLYYTETSQSGLLEQWLNLTK